MIYIDPPYGVKFGCNFQPFVRKRDVKHNDDEDMTREPEMVKAYRDTWELGLHSYLTYLRDRLLLARELLTPSGSVFVQIWDENLHHVREVMDEVFGAENFVSIIAFAKTIERSSSDVLPQSARLPPLVCAGHRAHEVPAAVRRSKELGEASSYIWIELPDGDAEATDAEERRTQTSTSGRDSRLCSARLHVEPATRRACISEFEFEGETYRPAEQALEDRRREGLNDYREAVG